jgi:hypothetical protein
MEPVLLPKQCVIMTTRPTSGIHNQLVALNNNNKNQPIIVEIRKLANNVRNQLLAFLHFPSLFLAHGEKTHSGSPSPTTMHNKPTGLEREGLPRRRSWRSAARHEDGSVLSGDKRSAPHLPPMRSRNPTFQ